MPERPTIGVEDRALDDLALEALAEAYAVTPPASLRQRGAEHVTGGSGSASARRPDCRAHRRRLIYPLSSSSGNASGGGTSRVRFRG